MRRLLPCLLLSAFVLPILLLMLAPGCTQNAVPDGPKKSIVYKAEKRTPLTVTAWDGVIRGKVVYDGEPPVMEFIDKIKLHEDHEGCMKGIPSETRKQAWFVHPENHGVRYVVVWLEPPAGKYFSLRDEDKKRPKEEVVIDQPHCAFIPHVAALYPSYFDGKDQVPTGQKLVVKNTAPFAHTIDWGQGSENDRSMSTMPPLTGRREFVLNPQKEYLPFGCGIHHWMFGILWIFDHPYHAVTREDGSFEIANVPSGVELTLKVWHESRADKPFEQRKITLTPGANPPIDLKIKK